MKPWVSIFFILYPLVQKLLAAKGLHLPDLGDLGSTVAQSAGTVGLATSDPIHKA